MKKDEKIKKPTAIEEYGAKAIKVLEGLEAVRKRPAMYIGSTSTTGLHHLVYEVVDNSVDEALGGHCNNIKVILHVDNSCSVEDNGRGIPVGIHPTEKISAAQVVLTKLHAGGKFEKDSYKYSGGLHGVGVSVVNALSSKLEVKICRDGKEYQQFYKDGGKPVAPLKEIGTSDKKGTCIRFYPDPSIFETVELNYDILASRFREFAFLNKGLRIDIKDERSEEENSFFYEGGIASFIEHINAKKNPLFPQIIHFEKDDGTYVVDFACQYNDGYSEQLFSFVNNIRTVEGGTHEAGFRSALTKISNRFAQRFNMLKDGASLSSDDVREGLVGVLSIKVPEPQFEGQTKTKLGNSEVKGIVDSWIYSFLDTYFEENPAIAKKILQKALLAQQARNAAKKARELTRRKTVLEGSLLPGKLADCSDTNAENTELYIVEGDSAGGCFSEDTQVALLDGRNLSFKDLVEEHKKGIKHYCYTINNDEKIETAQIKNPRKTKANAQVIKVVLDNDKEITCTPDHLFMLRNGSYKKAEELTQQDSLMPLYKKLSKIEKRITINGYEMVLDPKTHKWIFTHLLADRLNIKNNEYSINDGSHKHHVNFNKLDNNPNNIIRMTPEQHLELHRKMASLTLHTDDAKEKARQAHLTKEYKEKISAMMSTPKMKKMLSKRAKEQWKNEEYKKYMGKKYLEFYQNNEEFRKETLERLNKAQNEYWSKKENREKQADRVKKFFQQNPEIKDQYSKTAKQQWDNKELLEWRSQKTQGQWTDEFRSKRKETYNKTYYENTIQLLKKIYDQDKNFEKYEQERTIKRNPNLLKYDTFCSRFFDGNDIKLKEAIENYNHKIKEIIKLNTKIDVYDLEVEETHNFALGNGVFVHNSAKQGRDRFTQAILPLRGKIINVEKARLDKMLSNNEIKDLITAIGAGIGDEEFKVEKVRYHKVVIMTDADVDGSHIRILLLTFFFRHMKPLIENGYLYIAQPPLYKAKVGRTERYLKDDSELKQFLFDWAEENTVLKIDKQNFSGEDWKKLLDDVSKYEKEITKSSNNLELPTHHSHELVKFLDSIEWSLGKYEMQEIVTKLKEHFPKYEISGIREENQEGEMALESAPKPQTSLTFKEFKKTWEVPIKFFKAEETEKLLQLFKPLNQLEKIQWFFKIKTKEEGIDGSGILTLTNAIISTGKSLMTIQRYKGLGEMNPEQLWDTTMDPTTRTFLQVTIEDALKADQWFTALMGDDVSERRDYVEKHAHFVRNLDI